MASIVRAQSATALPAAVSAVIAYLAREASVELNLSDLKDLAASRALLPVGKKIYVSCLPGQTWDETETGCRALSGAGFRPVPHLPVRLLTGPRMLSRVLENLIGRANVEEVLLIAGDYPSAAGPYSCVADVLHSGLIGEHGLRRISIAAHPEGHPRVPIEVIRRAEREKGMMAAELGLETTFVTQFVFEAKCFLDWAGEFGSAGTRARVVAGLTGPASIAKLFRYAARCGIGPSIRALGARPSSAMKLLGNHSPEHLLYELAMAWIRGTVNFSGIHFFCFGGYLRTCEWLHALANADGHPPTSQS